MPNNNNLEIRSEDVQEILSYVPHWMIRWGNTLFFLLILLLLFISWFIKYPDTITAETILTTQIPPQKEFARVTGKIDTIFVDNNQYVKTNEPLAVLENTANYADVFLLKSIVDTITVKKESFTFPLNEIPIFFIGDIETSYDAFENSYIKYIINKDLDPFSYDTKANSITSNELNLRLSNLISQEKINKQELSFKEKDLKRSKSLFDKGVISEKDYELKQLEYLQAERNYKSLRSSISQLREAISNNNRAYKGKEIEDIRQEMTLLRNVIKSFNVLKKSIKDWEMRYLLNSEIDGKVSFLNYWSENQTVNQGDLVFIIIPDENSSFVAKLKTPSQNLGKVKVGQNVNIMLDNYPEYEFGVLKGKIETISETSDSEGFYTIDVSVSPELLTSYNKPINFKQEMRGSAEIITEDLRLIERFFYQLRNLFTTP